MDYELAKKLKDAGFPQRDPNGIKPFPNYTGYGCGFVYPLEDGQEQCYAPTLSELIEACGDNFFSLTYAVYENDGTETSPQKSWIANISVTKIGHAVFNDNFHQIGATPEEAVARLWLSLRGEK